MDLKFNFEYSILPNFISENEKLNSTEKILMAIIFSLNLKSNECFASNEYLSKKTNVSKRTITSSLAKLKKENLIIIEVINNQRKIFVGNIKTFYDLDALIDDKRVVVRTDKFQCLLVHQVKEGVGGRYVFAMSDMRLQLSGLTHVVAV